MAKVFRLHTGSADTLSDWGKSQKLGSMAIDSIPDPIGASDTKEITSIPSPFARVDLVKSAFKAVARGNLVGKTIHHKLVSDSLDVGQIFFNIESYRKSIEIIEWNKDRDIQSLLNSPSEEHKKLGRALSTFLEQDGDTYNFNKMGSLYLLNFKSGPNSGGNIIGATSPATLFFTSANDLSYLMGSIKFGNDTPFDGSYLPLYKRDPAYIKYYWSLKKSFPNFAGLFPEVNEYLDKCYAKLPPKIRGELGSITSTAYQSDYENISVQQGGQNFVYILGECLKHKKAATQIKDSGFEMKATVALKAGEKIPLVLPVDTYTAPTKYVIDPWDRNTKVPYHNDTPIQNRILPNDGTQYPYVTAGDFLEDSIIQIPYKFNSASFFDGNYDKRESECSYLLPLKRTFFDFFQISDLTSTLGGKKMIEMMQLLGNTGVKVILRIPINDTKGDGYIEYQRFYYKEGNGLKEQDGKVIEREFSLGLFPAIKYPASVEPLYRVSLLDRDSARGGRDNPYSLRFYDNNNEEIPAECVVRRNRNNDGSRIEPLAIDSVTYALTQGFGYIAIADGSSHARAIIIPRFASKAGGHKFRFAVDFGTTNTHIEYSVDGGTSHSFDISESDKQLQKLHTTFKDPTIKRVFTSDFIPDEIGGASEFRYPMRTALSEGATTNWGSGVFAMAHTNISFTYEKSRIPNYYTVNTNLKWASDNDGKMRASAYIENIIILLRNKVLLNGGDLSKTEIVWFYPTSMTQGKLVQFKQEWEQSFKKYFNATGEQIISIPESVAPYYYYKSKKGATSNVVSIDIGGGSTDVLFVKEGTPQYITSFGFAANALFGDGYSYDSDSNGFIRLYCPKIKTLFNKNKLIRLESTLAQIETHKDSARIIDFLFSLCTNRDVLDAHAEKVLDFSKILAEGDDAKKGKIVIVLFYTAIIYHVANIMRAKGMEMPRHITFSGNGSKILNILSPDAETIERFTKLIFEKVYGLSYPSDGLTVELPEEPKESTCKGGILVSPFVSQDALQTKRMNTILLGNDKNEFVKDGMGYNAVDTATKDSVITNISRFIDFAFGLNSVFSFHDMFDVDGSLLDKAKAICLKDLKTYLDNGLSLKQKAIKESGANTDISETLFFYPLVGMLNALSRQIL